MTQDLNLGGAKRDMLAARPIVPAFIAVIYGCYKFYALGFGLQHYLYTYVLVVGGVASIASIILYLEVISSAPGRSLGKMFAAFSGLIPYAFSLYLFGFLGIYSLWTLISSEFTVTTLLFGIVWILLGYRMLFTFWQITEIGEARRLSRRSRE